MPFETGSISFRRYAVLGKQPLAITARMIEDINHYTSRAEIIEEVEYFWSGGQHLFDDQISFENNVFSDCLSLALRIDTSKVPPAVKKSYLRQEETALAKNNPSGFISKAQKREAKDTVAQRCEADVKSGKYRRTKLIPLLWDVPNQILYSPASGDNFAKLAEIFERTFKLELLPLSAGTIAQRQLVSDNKRVAFEDAKPTKFAQIADKEAQPDYPWNARSANGKDFLGNEFLLWLWFARDERDNHEIFDQYLFDRSLDLDCAFGISGKDSIRGTGPTHLPEAKEALRIGKVPRQAGLILLSHGNQFEFILNAETLAITSLKLPPVEEAETPRVLFEERIAFLRDFTKTLDALYVIFLQLRVSPQWPATTKEIQAWIKK